MLLSGPISAFLVALPEYVEKLLYFIVTSQDVCVGSGARLPFYPSLKEYLTKLRAARAMGSHC